MGVFVLVLPALTGMFWGAPLAARELETGTFRLAWTRSVRQRWMAVKLAVLGSASMAAAGLFGLMATWWARPYNLTTQFIGGRFAPGQFEIQGIVPAGYAAFAFTATVTAGMLIGRTLPAMATGLAAFAGAQLAVRDWVRPHLMAPVRLSPPLNYGGGGGFRGTAGSGFLPIPGGPPAPGGGQGNCAHNLAAKLHGLFIYQPAGRYWLFQACETAIFTALAVLLALFCLWWVRRAGGMRWQLAFWGKSEGLPAGAARPAHASCAAGPVSRQDLATIGMSHVVAVTGRPLTSTALR